MTIPDNVTSIGRYAFYACSNLTAVRIHDLAAWCGIEFEEFYANPLCYAHHLYLDGEEVVDLTIPDGVTSIGSYAFYNCSGLTSVTIPGSVTSIGDSAFCGCSGLTSVTIPQCVCTQSLPSVFESAYMSITTVVIGETVTSIERDAFSRCRGLTSVTIPNSVRSIGNHAFADCSSLTAVHIHDLAAWCGIEFETSSANPLYYAHHLYLNGDEVTTLTIPDSVTSIGRLAFYNCIGLTSVTIGNAVVSIGNSAFDGCSGLTNVIIHDSVTSIGSAVFYDCSGLTSVTIGNGVTSIGSAAFYNCSDLMSVAIGNGVTSIEGGAFYGCNGLTSVTIPDSVASIGSAAFYNCSGLTSVMIPDSVTSIGDGAFVGCSGLTNVTIGDSVASIGDWAFSRCSGLASVTIPDSVTSIGHHVFDGCNGLQTLYVPESWKTKYVDGEFWSSYAGVPEGCEIVYGASPEAPATSTGVPYTWLEEHGLGDGTAEGYEAVAAADAANGSYKVWECYVAGLDPTDPAARFTAAIGFTNGTPVVSWTPDLNESGTPNARTYIVQGKPTITNDWGVTNASSRFFRVLVKMPE